MYNVLVVCTYNFCHQCVFCIHCRCDPGEREQAGGARVATVTAEAGGGGGRRTAVADRPGEPPHTGGPQPTQPVTTLPWLATLHIGPQWCSGSKGGHQYSTDTG